MKRSVLINTTDCQGEVQTRPDRDEERNVDPMGAEMQMEALQISKKNPFSSFFERN